MNAHVITASPYVGVSRLMC